jgi:hypothetical protein
MRKSWLILLYFVVLVLGLSLAVPAEDLPETAYDESEAAPYEITPRFSCVMSQAAALAVGAVRSALHLRCGTPFQFAVACITDTGSHPSAEARIALGRVNTT